MFNKNYTNQTCIATYGTLPVHVKPTMAAVSNISHDISYNRSYNLKPDREWRGQMDIKRSAPGSQQSKIYLLKSK